MIDPPGGFVSGGTYLFQLDAFKDGVAWDITGGVVTLYLKKSGASVLSNSATLPGSPSNRATYTSTTLQLTPGLWRASWKVVKGGIEVESDADSFNVAPSLA